MLLNINKPTGLTSRDVVDHIQRLVRPLRCGHAGTLDPLASGVLLVCVGNSTRLVPFLHELPKAYTASFLLGRRSPTDDIEGVVEELTPAPEVTRAQVLAAIPEFLGTINQVPPAYSAVMVRGRRAYQLARQGEHVELTPRSVTIHQLELTGWEPPVMQLRMVCSSGTYVRSLGRDLAARVGTAAVMSQLTRTAIGPFPLAQSLPLADLDRERLQTAAIPAISALPHLPRVLLQGEAVMRTRCGQPLTIDPELYGPLEIVPAPWSTSEIEFGNRPRDLLAALDEEGELIALVQERNDRLWPVQVFQPARR